MGSECHLSRQAMVIKLTCPGEKIVLGEFDHKHPGLVIQETIPWISAISEDDDLRENVSALMET